MKKWTELKDWRLEDARAAAQRYAPLQRRLYTDRVEARRVQVLIRRDTVACSMSEWRKPPAWARCEKPLNRADWRFLEAQAKKGSFGAKLMLDVNGR